MKPSLILSDIDGTLLDRGSVMSGLTQKTIAELAHKKVLFATASARSLTNIALAMGPVFDRSCASACANGGYVITSDGTVLDDKPVEDKMVPDLIKGCDDIGASFCCVSISEAAGVVRHDIYAEAFKGFHHKFQPVDILRSPDFKTYLICIYGEDITPVRSIIEENKAYFSVSPPSISPRTGFQFMMVQSHGADKGTALLKLADHYGIPVEATMAIGDGAWNDGPMLQSAGLAVAMKNARDSIIELADRVTEFDNNDSGAARFIREIFGMPE